MTKPTQSPNKDAYAPHRQGLHSDDRPYPNEPLCYCDQPTPISTPTNTSLDEILREYRSKWNITDKDHDKFVAKLTTLITQHDQALKTKLIEDREKYDELIMAVGNKFEGETRHETALRYIKWAEQGHSEKAAHPNNDTYGGSDE